MGGAAEVGTAAGGAAAGTVLKGHLDTHLTSRWVWRGWAVQSEEGRVRRQGGLPALGHGVTIQGIQSCFGGPGAVLFQPW